MCPYMAHICPYKAQICPICVLICHIGRTLIAACVACPGVCVSLYVTNRYCTCVLNHEQLVQMHMCPKPRTARTNGSFHLFTLVLICPIYVLICPICVLICALNHEQLVQMDHSNFSHQRKSAHAPLLQRPVCGQGACVYIWCVCGKVCVCI